MRATTKSHKVSLKVRLRSMLCTWGFIFSVLGGLLILFTVFVSDLTITNGLIMGRVFWFHKSMLVLAGITLLTIVSCGIVARRNTNEGCIRLMLPDILVLFFYGITLFTYDWKLHPEPEKLLFGGQLVVLWFILRVLLKSFPSLKLFFLAVILLIGCIEAFWGLEQLYGYRASNHHLFRLTGSFFNPGPYSGYLAVILPVSLSFILRIGKFKRFPWWHYSTILYYLSWICFVMILLVLPAGMSRSAWLAGIVSCGWVYSTKFSFRKKTLCNFRYFVVLTSVIFVCVIGLSALFMMKKDSANGRLLMWKVTAQAISHQPLTGTGLGGFPAAFAEEQAVYFESDKATPTEKLVAGCPEYAFNEYLQIGLEQGIPGLVCFLLWFIICFYYGIKNRRFGAAGGILAFAVFAFSSYPLQLASFWILLIFLSVICVAEPCSFIPQKRFPLKVNTLYISILAVISATAICFSQQKRYIAYKEWNTLTMLYNNQAYETVSEQYKKIYPLLNHKPEYLFEYAQCLSKTGNYLEANKLLKRAKQLSADPMLWYMIAKNEQALGKYEDAEMHLIHGINILPERIYPYYLLSKLYAESEFFHPEKLQAAIDSVLIKEPKVHTTAINEMREEVKKIYGYLLYL